MDNREFKKALFEAVNPGILEVPKSRKKNESFDTYAVAWREVDRQDRIVSKQKEFRTAEARDSFISRIVDNPKFYEIIATSDPEPTENNDKNESIKELNDLDDESSQINEAAGFKTLNHNNVGIGDKFKLIDGGILIIHDQGPNYLFIEVKGSGHDFRKEVSNGYFDDIEFEGKRIKKSK